MSGEGNAFDIGCLLRVSGVAKTEHHPVARLKYRTAFRRLSRYPCPHDCFLRRYPKIPRCLQQAPDIGVFRAAIESNQLHQFGHCT